MSEVTICTRTNDVCNELFVNKSIYYISSPMQFPIFVPNMPAGSGPEKRIDSTQTIAYNGNRLNYIYLNETKSYSSNINNIIINILNLKKAKRGESLKSIMKTTIPVPFALFGLFTMLFFLISLLFFITGFNTGFYIINPWYNIMLCIGFLGLLCTDVVAIFERRNHQNGKG